MIFLCNNSKGIAAVVLGWYLAVSGKVSSWQNHYFVCGFFHFLKFQGQGWATHTYAREIIAGNTEGSYAMLGNQIRADRS